MYEHYRDEIMIRLDKVLEASQREKVIAIIDAVSADYEISEKCTELATTENDIPELVKMFIACKKIEGLSNNTLRNYTYHLKGFFATVKLSPENVTTNDVRKYLYLYQQKKEIQNCSLDKVRQCLSSFYGWCTEEEYIDKNPMKKIPKIKCESKQRQFLTQMDLELLRMVCKTDRERAIIEILYSTGCRIPELANLKISDIDFQTKKVHLVGKGNKHRDSYINAKAEVAIKQYLATRKGSSEYLIIASKIPYNNVTSDSLRRSVKKISRRATEVNTVTPHILRHTMATTALHNGMPIESIQALLGHASINTTMRYAHTDIATIKQQHQQSVI